MKPKNLCLAIVGICISAILIAGCSSDSKNNGNNNDDGGPDGGDGDSMSFITVEWSADTSEWVPVEGVTVAFDAPGGQRTESLSGADGKVTFENIDWSLGTASVTGHLVGSALTSFVGFGQNGADSFFSIDGLIAILIVPFPENNWDTTTVTGTPTGLIDPDNNDIYLFPFGSYGEFYEGSGADPYEFVVEKGAAFSLVGVEATDGTLPSGVGYFVDIDCAIAVDHDAISEDTAVLDLDFSSTDLLIDLQRADGSFALPERAESPLRDAWPNVWLMDWNTIGASYAGWAEEIDLSTDGNAFDVSYVWVEPEFMEAPYTFYQVWNSDTNEGSFVYKDGYPEAGELAPRMIDVPTWVTPDSPWPAHPLHDAIEYELFDEDVTDITLNLLRNGYRLWMISPMPTATSITVPLPPSSVDKSSFFGTLPMEARLYTGVVSPNAYYWERVAVSTAVSLMPPVIEGDYWEDGVCFGDSPNEPSSPDCNGVSYEGCCDANGKIIWCDGGKLYCANCAGEGDECGWNAEWQFYACLVEPGGEDPSGVHPIDCP